MQYLLTELYASQLFTAQASVCQPRKQIEDAFPKGRGKLTLSVQWGMGSVLILLDAV